jgi:hypothetical protein
MLVTDAKFFFKFNAIDVSYDLEFWTIRNFV